MHRVPNRERGGDTEHYDHFYKSNSYSLISVILTGDAGTGKSNFLLRYIKGAYENATPTIGVEFAYKVALLKNKTKVKAQIWDTCKFILMFSRFREIQINYNGTLPICPWSSFALRHIKPRIFQELQVLA